MKNLLLTITVLCGMALAQAPPAPINLQLVSVTHGDDGTWISFCWDIVQLQPSKIESARASAARRPPLRDMATYTVYRADSESGPWVKFRTPSLSKVQDPTVVSGHTYRYAVTSTDPKTKISSPKSQPIKVVVP